MPDDVAYRSLTVTGLGAYTLSEAARLIGVPASKLRRWIAGSETTAPLWRSQLEGVGDLLEIGFRDLMEARVVSALRSEDRISLQLLRRMRDEGIARSGSERPFSSGTFRTDGKTIFWEAAVSEGDPHLEDLRSGQLVFWSLVKQTFKSMDMLDNEPRRWWPQPRRRTIVVDPARSFGQPILAESGVPTRTVAEAVEVEGSASKVARLYEIEPRSVRDAVDFERNLAA